MIPAMVARMNLADPAYEPSDDDLARLMHDAFEGLRDSREESLRTMRARIERLQVGARGRFAANRRPLPVLGSRQTLLGEPAP